MREEQFPSSSGEESGIPIADILALPDELQTIITCLTREGEAGLPEVAAFIGQDEATTRAMLADLIARGFAQEVPAEGKGQPRYRARLVSRRTRKLRPDL
jgi:Mn-dependent DtxR family transcriptional regulator